MRLTLLFTSLTIAIVVNAGDRPCPTIDSDRSALEALLRADWSRITTDKLTSHWRHATPWVMNAGNASCSGTTTLSNLARVIDNECRCCDTFVFENIETGLHECAQRLSSMTLIRTAPNRGAAKAAAESFRAAIAVVPQTGFQQDGIAFASVGSPSTGISQAANLTVANSPEGYTLTLVIYRVEVGAAH